MDTVVDLNQLKEYAYNAGLALAVAVIIYLFLYLVDYLIKKLKKRLLSLNLKSFRLFGLEVINVGKQVEAEIEILSPHFRAQRDGTPSTIVNIDDKPADN